MTFFEIKKTARQYYPSIALDRFFPRTTRRLVVVFLGLISFLLLLPTVFYYIPSLYTGNPLAFLSDYAGWYKIGAGVFFLILPLWLVVVAIHGFFNSYYFRGFESTLKERLEEGNSPISFETAVFSYYADPDDATLSLFKLSYGELLLLRAGLSADDIKNFLTSRKSTVSTDSLRLEPGAEDGRVRMSDIAYSIYKADKEFAAFLFSKKIQEPDYLEAVRWLSADISRTKKKARWWGKDSLGRVQGFGKDWAYGGTWKLKRYAVELTNLLLPSLESRPLYIRNDVDRLEAVLAKAREANALLVGEDGGSKRDVLLGLVNRIQDGKIFPQLEHKKVFELDSSRLVSASASAGTFEKEVIAILDESVAAGNVILVVSDMADFVRSASQVGTNLASLLSPYLASREIQVIGLSNPTAFHQIIEPVSTLIESFDVIMVKEGGAGETMETLEEEAEKVEVMSKLNFSVPVLRAVGESAERYITEGVMPDKAVDLLYEVAGQMSKKGRRHVAVEDVLDYIKERTGIPAGSVSSQEKAKLIDLENILHKRVIGQNEAVDAISSAMKRSRAGLTSPSRPMGSFLFLGPTGVGKTETTKALAEVFFGDENKILRLDMSEYNGLDALSKLIGSFETKSPGVLSSMLREKPYGVLLLDEFEKANKEVMDLFLQVLDEGFFSDMYGQKINARNLIIIATSNAGSDIIYETVKRGDSLVAKKGDIIDGIVKEGIYRPELLNRFDGIILFHPISSADLKEIARLMLSRLARRLAAKGYELVINDALLDYLVKFGSDPKFGARPMNRAIQDKVEQRIADKIIKNELTSGQKIEFSVKDMESFY